MKRPLRFLFILTMACCGLAGSAPAALGSHLPPGFRDETVFEGLEEPTIMRFAPNGKVFVAEKSGVVKVWDSLADTSATVFADLRTQTQDFWDRGLLGLAVDLGFPARTCTSPTPATPCPAACHLGGVTPVRRRPVRPTRAARSPGGSRN